MPKLILDVMGGDKAPHAILEGAIQALPELHGELVLLGDRQELEPLLRKRRYHALARAIASAGSDPAPACKVSFIHSSQTIEMDDSIREIRKKPNASINVGCALAAAAYCARSPEKRAAFISAGHSGAVMASALIHMGRLGNVERPAIAVKLPTFQPDGCVMIDAGANVDCKPEHLRDFAVMGSLFAQVERESPGLPRVGILSNGEEKGKGNELTRAAAELLAAYEPLNSPPPGGVGQYVGYAEGKEIFKGSIDVVVTDGFVGNVVLKSLEGLGLAIAATLKSEAKRSPLATLGFLLAAGMLRRFKRKFDYAEYGAAPLLGVAGYAFICHGRSNPKAIKSALLRAQRALQEGFVEKLEDALTHAMSHTTKKGAAAQT